MPYVRFVADSFRPADGTPHSGDPQKTADFISRRTSNNLGLKTLPGVLYTARDAPHVLEQAHSKKNCFRPILLKREIEAISQPVASAGLTVPEGFCTGHDTEQSSTRESGRAARSQAG